MPLVMSLEGLQLSPVERFTHRVRSAFDPDYGGRAHFYGLGATAPIPPPPPGPLPPLSPMDMYLMPFKAHPFILLLGIFGGMMYAARKK